MGKPKLITNTKQFIQKANKLHNKFYQYSKVVYKKTDLKVCIICPIHGEFWQTPQHHLHEHGCQKCGPTKGNSGRRIKTTECFIKLARKKQGNTYNYDKVVYISSYKLITITCKKHGDFEQTPSAHLCGQGCQKCAKEHLSNIRNSNTKDFLKKAKKLQKSIDYSKVNYKNAKEKVIFICKLHGEFCKSPNTFLRPGYPCPTCSRQNRTGINYNSYFKKGKNPKSILYFLKFEGNGEKFYKIGITIKDLKFRFGDSRYKKYKITEIWTMNLPLRKSWKLEQEFLKKYKKFQYIPKDFKGGKNECFSKKLSKLVL